MSVRSLRITEDIEAAIQYVADREPAEQAQSLRKLARMGFEAYIAKHFQAGEVSLREAAGLLRVTPWDALDRLAALGAAGNATAEAVLAGLDILEATRSRDSELSGDQNILFLQTVESSIRPVVR